MDIRVDSLNFDQLRLIDEQGQLEEFNLRHELGVNENNLALEMLEQPSKYIYWSSVLERVKMYQESAEMRLEITVAELDKDARSHFEVAGQKATKDMVDAFIKRDPRYEEAKTMCQQYDYIAGRLNRIVKAFEQRKDMLQSYGKQIADQKVFGKNAGTFYPKAPGE